MSKKLKGTKFLFINIQSMFFENSRSSIQSWMTILLGISYSIIFVVVNYQSSGSEKSELKFTRTVNAKNAHQQDQIKNPGTIVSSHAASGPRRSLKLAILADLRDSKAIFSLNPMIYSWTLLKSDSTKIYIRDFTESSHEKMHHQILNSSIRILKAGTSNHLLFDSDSTDVILWLRDIVALYQDFVDAIDYIHSQFDEFAIISTANHEYHVTNNSRFSAEMDLSKQIHRWRIQAKTAENSKTGVFAFKTRHMKGNLTLSWDFSLKTFVTNSTKVVDVTAAVAIIRISSTNLLSAQSISLQPKDKSFETSLHQENSFQELYYPALAPWVFYRCTASRGLVPGVESSAPCVLNRARNGLAHSSGISDHKPKTDPPTLNSPAKADPPTLNSPESGPWKSQSPETLLQEPGSPPTPGSSPHPAPPLSGILSGREQDQAWFADLVQRRADSDGTVVLVGFNEGYRLMLANMACRLSQLGVSNFLAAAFDEDAYAFCIARSIPCFLVAPEEPGGGGGGGEAREQGAQSFGSKAFRVLTKLKSLQVLRFLRMGMNVLWSDVDVFWKIHPLPGMLKAIFDAHQSIAAAAAHSNVPPAGGGPAEVDLVIQSNAPYDEAEDNGYRRINSGFYYVRAGPRSLAAFQAIVNHARSTRLSEQPSFYTVLCGDRQEYVEGTRACYNPTIPTRTVLLDRGVYPNGAMHIENVTATSRDDVAIVHFNWVAGLDNKTNLMRKASMWLVDDSGKCSLSI